MKGDVLRQVRELSLGLHPFGDDAAVIDCRVAAVGPEQSTENPESCGLTYAVRPEQERDLARARRERQSVQHFLRSVRFAQVSNLDHGLFLEGSGERRWILNRRGPGNLRVLLREADQLQCGTSRQQCC